MDSSELIKALLVPSDRFSCEMQEGHCSLKGYTVDQIFVLSTQEHEVVPS